MSRPKFTALGVNRTVHFRRSSGIGIHPDRTGARDQCGRSLIPRAD